MLFSKDVIRTRQLVAQDLPPTGSEANTTIFFFIYILDIDSHSPYLLLFFYKIFF